MEFSANSIIQVDTLDRPIVEEEIIKVFKKSKNGKSAGLDSLTKDIIWCLFETHPTIVLRFFNNILNTGIFPQTWRVALIVLVHKKGHITELDNYRGISLLSVLSKLFTSILNARVFEWAINNNKFSSSQLGFMKGLRTSDAISILHNVIDDYCYRKKNKLYSCFVDFKKAFDCVPREIMMNKLWRMGLTGKVFQVIKSMYTGDSVRIKMGNVMSSSVSVSQGVKQGCVLSPTLFNLFLSDFPKTLSSLSGDPIYINNNHKISCIMWEDDIVMLSQSKRDYKIKSMHSINIQWTINYQST